MSPARVLAVAALAALAIPACGSSEPATPKARMEEAIRATEDSKTLTFTLDGSGEVARETQAAESLFFGSNGEVQFPKKVHMVMNIDRPTGGVRSEILHISDILYVRPASPADAKWQRSSQAVALAGFDPLAAFDFKTLRETRQARDAGETKLDGVPTHKVRLLPTEKFRKDAESRLPAGWEATRLEIKQDVWISNATQRILRVLQRFDYIGRTHGYFQTDLRLADFGKKLALKAPGPSQISDQPLRLDATPTPAPAPSKKP